uniref:Uncharacterized protein n=1 Tax=Arundo donax TaxID=35708 RepID=A0A0A8ZV71_ARUDO
MWRGSDIQRLGFQFCLVAPLACHRLQLCRTSFVLLATVEHTCSSRCGEEGR